MKNLFAIVLCLLIACFTCTALADYAVGDTVEVAFELDNPNGACNFNVYLSYESDVFEYISISPATGLYGGPNGFGYAAMTPFAGGPIGSVVFKIKEGAEPGKTYSISGYPDASVDENFNPVDVMLSGGATVKIKGGACTTHTWNSGKVITEANCVNTGVTKHTCTACGETREETIPATNVHVEGTPITTKLASCKEAGEEITPCSTCGKTLATKTLPPLEHEAGDTVVTKEATCTETGTQVTQCKNCGKTIKSETIPAKEHTLVVDKAVAATCTATGLTEGKHCSECKAVIVKQEVVPVKPHEKGNAVVSEKPSCTKPGLQSYKCTVCGAEIENEEIPPVGHTEGTAERTKDPSCTEKGEEVVKCTVCGDIVKTNPVDMIDHTSDEGTVTTEPTCTVPGVKTYKCTVCGERMKTEAVAVVPHTEDEGAVTVEPNCAKEGVKTFKCSVCGKELRTDSVPVTDHIPGEWVVVKPAEGNEDGLKELYCSVCGELIETAVIPGSVWYHMTVSSIGPRFRDVSDLTNKWNMFTVVDLSVDGEQTFDLIAGDIHVVGTMTVKVADGKVTVTYSLINKDMSVKAESLSIVGGLDAITSLEELPAYNFGEEISIADQLGGDTVVLIYIKNVVHYESDVLGLKDFIDGRAYTKLVEEMMANVK